MTSMSSAAFLHLCHRLQVRYPLILSVTVQLYVTAKKYSDRVFKKISLTVDSLSFIRSPESEVKGERSVDP